jgi:hypothetical protein
MFRFISQIDDPKYFMAQRNFHQSSRTMNAGFHRKFDIEVDVLK